MENYSRIGLVVFSFKNVHQNPQEEADARQEDEIQQAYAPVGQERDRNEKENVKNTLVSSEI